MSFKYGPSRPPEASNCGYQLFTNKNYLKGYSRKIVYDLKKIASLYNGHQVNIFVVDQSERCPKCTNMVTGEKLISKCPVCNGTGYKDNYKNIGEFWVYTDFTPAYKMASPYGNTESPNGTKLSIIIIDAPLLHDQTIVAFNESKELFKIYDVEPYIVAMRGDVVAQIAQCTLLTHGSNEYKLLENERLKHTISGGESTSTIRNSSTCD